MSVLDKLFACEVQKPPYLSVLPLGSGIFGRDGIPDLFHIIIGSTDDGIVTAVYAVHASGSVPCKKDAVILYYIADTAVQKMQILERYKQNLVIRRI